MLLYIFIILGTWAAGVLGEEDICDKYQHEVCVFPDGWSIPETEEDMDRQCPIFLQNLDCLNDYSKKCYSSDENSDSREDFRNNLKKLAEDACQKDSQLHSRIVENIQCLHDTITDDLPTCYEDLKEKRNILAKHMEKISAEKGMEEGVYEEEIWLPSSCLIHSLEGACLATKTDAKCGSDTKDLVLEVIHKAGFIRQSCEPAYKDRLEEYKAVLKLESEEETALNQILNTK